MGIAIPASCRRFGERERERSVWLGYVDELIKKSKAGSICRYLSGADGTELWG